MQTQPATLFIVTLSYLDLKKRETCLQNHRDFLTKYYEQGIFLVSGPQEPLVGGIILARATTYSALDEIMQQDPFYKAGAARYAITEFKAVKYHDDFSACLKE